MSGPASLAGRTSREADGSRVERRLAHVRIVLVEPSHRGNVGSTARAMKVMGLSRLVLVRPRHPDALVHADARALASGAFDVLESAIVHDTLDAALDGTTLAVALSAREREYAPAARTPAQACESAIVRADAGDDVAFVFGSERFGLSNEDVLRCNARCRIETSETYASLNLAQAVQLIAHGCRLAATDGVARAVDDAAVLATHEEREAVLAHLEEALVAIGYLDPDAPKKLMARMRRLFARAALEREEAQWLRGIAKAMLKER